MKKPRPVVTVRQTPVVDESEALEVARALRRAQRLGRHPLVATVLDLGFTEQGRPWMAQEPHRPFTATDRGEVLAMAVRLSEALAAFHDAGEQHGALSLRSVLMTPGGPVVGILDLTVTTTETTDDVRALALLVTDLLGERLPSLADALAVDPRLRPSAREVGEVLTWVQRTEGLPVTEPTGVTLRAVEEPPVDLADLGWVPGVLTTDMGGAAPTVRRRVSAAAVVGAAALLVGAAGVAAIEPVGHTATRQPGLRFVDDNVAVVLDPATGAVVNGGATTASGQTIGAGGMLRIPVLSPAITDPLHVFSGEDAVLVDALFAPLVGVDATGKKIDDGSASSAAVSSNHCLTWTFTLKPGTFSNGDQVDAAAYIRGWTRAARQSTDAAESSDLFDVVGYDQLQSGDMSTLPGVTAPDPATLVVQLVRPDCAFDVKTAQPTFAPYDGLALAPDDEGQVGDGPFVLGDDKLSLVRNDNYAYGAPAHLATVRLTLTPAEIDGYDAFMAGTVDVADVPPAEASVAGASYGVTGDLLTADLGGVVVTRIFDGSRFSDVRLDAAGNPDLRAIHLS